MISAGAKCATSANPSHNERGAAMATATLVSVSEYLNSSYRPDREMLEGQLLERNVGEYDHSNLQGALVALLRQRQHEWKIRVLPEQRLQVSATRFRVPDV